VRHSVPKNRHSQCQGVGLCYPHWSCSFLQYKIKTSSITDEKSIFETCMYGASNFNMFNIGILIHINCCMQCKHDTCSRHCRIKNKWIHYQILENLTIWHFAIEIRT
jgi:hypothetical protein